METLSAALSWIMQPCYDLTGDWWAAIALFTLVVKVILLPLSLWCQKNSITLVQLMPQINRLKAEYYGDRETIGERQNELYKEKHYHPLLSVVPLVLQIIVLIGLVDLVHRVSLSGAPGTESIALIPIIDGGNTWFMPLAAGASAVILGFAQNHINPLQREQTRREQVATNGLTVVLSLVLGVFVGLGLAFYWICSNLLGIFMQLLCNLIINPKKHIDYDDLARSKEELAALDGQFRKKGGLFRRDPNARREKADYKRFFKIEGKHLVFYSEGSSFYRYVQGAIEWLLENSDVNIHYVTNDPDDRVFEVAKENPRVLPYYISERRAIPLMMKMDADVVASSLNQLDTFHIKRSRVRDDIEYVYLFHHMTSTTMVPPAGSYDHYDTILCVGPHQPPEIREAERMGDLPPKKLVKCGYDLLDREIAAYEAQASEAGEPSEVGQPTGAGQPSGPGQPSGSAKTPTVLVAPSWQEDNLLDLYADEVIGSLAERGYHVIVRPHPEYVKRHPARWNVLKSRYADEPLVSFEGDLGSNTSVFSSDLVVTDWSSIGCEFSFATLKPTLFVNTPMKAHNPDWERYSTLPVDITLRDKIGVPLDTENIGRIGKVAASMLANGDAWKSTIKAEREKTVYNLGWGGAVAGKYLLQTLLAKQAEKAKEAELIERAKKLIAESEIEYVR